MTHYRVRVRRGDAEVEVDSSEKDYTESKLKELLPELATEGTVPPKGSVQQTRRISATEASRKPLSMVEYVRLLGPKTGSQYVVAVGDYLEKHGGMQAGFRTRDIVEGFVNVKYKHSNPAEAVRQAKTQGLLMDGKEAGTLLVTATGENWVKVQADAATTE